MSPTRLVKSCAQTRASVLVIAELSFGPERGVCKATSQKIEALVKEMDIRGIRQRTRILVVSSASDDFARAKRGGCDLRQFGGDSFICREAGQTCLHSPRMKVLPE